MINGKNALLYFQLLGKQVPVQSCFIHLGWFSKSRTAYVFLEVIISSDSFTHCILRMIYILNAHFREFVLQKEQNKLVIIVAKPRQRSSVNCL